MRVLLLILMCSVIFGCWYQSEVLSIDNKGNAKWLIVVSPDWGFSSLKEVKQQTDEYVEEMRKAGWEVTLKPIKSGGEVMVGLKGNLWKVSTLTSFYRMTKQQDSIIDMVFSCPYYGEEDVVRRIKLKSGGQLASVTNADGIAVDTATCNGGQKYRVKF